MEDQTTSHFNKTFWFCVCTEFFGLLFLAALIWVPVPKENQTMATATFGFMTATVIGIPLSYLIGGNPTGKKENVSTDEMKVKADNVNVQEQ